MDIQTALTSLMASSVQVDNPVALKPGQELTVKVISRLAEKNTFLVNYAGKTIAAKANQTIQIEVGQQMKLQVLKVQPSVILKVLDAAAESKPGSSPEKAAPVLLQFNSTAASAKPAQQPLWTLGQQINAKIVHIDDQKIFLQIAIKSAIDKQGNVPAKPLAGTAQNLQTAAAKPALSDYNRKTVVTLPAATGRGETYKTGQPVRLQVVRTDPEPAFKILPQAQQVQETITAALRQLLPSQQAPTALLTLIQHIPQQADPEQLPETLQRLARLILTQLPTRKQLQSGDSLKQAIQDSGLFLETKLALGKPENHLRQDFKGNLLKFLQTMQRASPATEVQQQSPAKALLVDELRQKSEGSLAKLVLDQLSSLPRDDSSRQLWNLELPYLDREEAQSVQMAIEWEKQSKQHPEDNANWSVTIVIAPPLLGMIHCKLAFCDNTLNTQFWSERTGTAELIEDNLEYLQQQIEAAGLKTGLLRVHQGPPESQRKTAQENRRLFDDQA